MSKEQLRQTNQSNMGQHKQQLTAVMLIVLQSVLYGLGDPISKVAYEEAPLFELLTIRYGIALIAMMLTFGRKITTGIKACSWRDWILPVICMGGAYVSNNIGLLLTQATTVAFIRSLPTIIAPLLAFILYKRKYSKGLIAIQLAVVGGIYMLCCGRGGLGSGFGLGEVFSLLAAVLLAGTLVFGERSLNRVDPITLSALQTAASVIFAAIGMLVSNVINGAVGSGDAENAAETSTWITMPSVWLAIIYLAILCTVLGYVLQNLALEKIEAHTVAMTQGLCPVMTAVFSMIILGERMSLFGACGALIILVGLLLALKFDND